MEPWAHPCHSETTAMEQKHPSHTCKTRRLASLNRSSDFLSSEDAWNHLAALGRRKFAQRKDSVQTLFYVVQDSGRHTDQSFTAFRIGMGIGCGTGSCGYRRTNEPRRYSGHKDWLTCLKDSSDSSQSSIQLTSYLRNTWIVVCYELTF